MIAIPSIDLKDGVCVRLKKGDFQTVHKVSEDALATALQFQEDGAEWLHIVDLDGALDGIGKNDAIIRSIAEKTGLHIEMGGGLRDMEALKRADALGVTRMVIGSAAVDNPAFVSEAVRKYGDRIAVGIDAKDGMVKTSGWITSAGIHFIALAEQMEQLGVKYLIFTDIDTDGMLAGPSLERLKLLRDAVSCEIIASGGIASLEDLMRVKALGAYGAIIGKAIYTGHVHLKEAIQKCKQ